ncbi:DNA-binding protein [Candidatus Woesearchaeota archaeon]|nr:MAG: DNA-binding protein [Candidatus Woesearchaeota archaeon]
MKFKKSDNKYIVRLEKGEEIIEQLTNLCKHENIKAGYILGLGAINKAELGLYNLTTKEYKSKEIEGSYEITILNGNISIMNGDPYLHVHITVSDDNFQVFGGHCKYAIVSATCEITIFPIDTDIDRYFDREIGLNLYKI